MCDDSETHPIATLNVLSQGLFRPDWYGWCEEGANDYSKRLELVKEWLYARMREDCVVCLQELTMDMANDLHPYFQDHYYSFVYHNRTCEDSGNMGVGIAWSNERYILIKQKTVLPSQEIEEWMTQPTNLHNWVYTLDDEEWKRGTEELRKTTPELVKERELYKKRMEVYDTIHTRNNAIVMVQLQPRLRKMDYILTVATCHLPCKFWLPHAMTYFWAKYVGMVKDFADGHAIVMCGDLNLKASNTERYLRMVHPSKDIDGSNMDYGPDGYTDEQFWWDGHTPERQALRSAFSEANDDKEPLWTAYSDREGQKDKDGNDVPNFREVLDYILIQNGVHPGYEVELESVPGYAKVYPDNSATGKIPSTEWPSDHKAIRVVLKTSKPKC